MVRLVSSGTEATMSAIRLARGFTGRDVIIKFAGNYHGHVDSLLVAAGSSAATLGVPNSPGVTAGTTQRHDRLAATTTWPAWKQPFAEHGPRIAGVIFEPIVGNMGCVVPSREFLTGAAEADHAARRAADLRRSDDRLSRGLRRRASAAGHSARSDNARQDRRRRDADRRLRRPRATSCSTCCPRAKCFKPARSAATRSPPLPASPRSRSSANNPPYERLEALCSRLERRLGSAAAKASRHSARLTRVGSMLTLFFNTEPPTDWDTAAKATPPATPNTFGACSTAASTCPAASTKPCSSPPPIREADIDATVACGERSFPLALKTTNQKRIATKNTKSHQEFRQLFSCLFVFFVAISQPE